MFLKPLFDRTVALVGLLLLWPVLLVIALLVRVKIGKPVFFVQERIGKDGKPFRIHKFHTMADGLDDSPISIAGPATLKYRLEDEMIAEYVAQKQKEGDTRSAQEIAVEYNDTVIYPDKVRLNCYYYRHYSFVKDIQMLFCTVLGRGMEYAGERI